MLPLEDMLTVKKLIHDKTSYRTMNIFGLIVYTEEHPFIVKVLRDKDYWSSLNARTRNWILYAIKPDDHFSHLTYSDILPKMGINNQDELPQLMIIAIGPDGIIRQKGFPIKDNDEVTAYNSIIEQISVVNDAASKIYPEYRSSTNVHREVVKALEDEFLYNRWKKLSEPFYKFISFFYSDNSSFFVIT